MAHNQSNPNSAVCNSTLCFVLLLSPSFNNLTTCIFLLCVCPVLRLRSRWTCVCALMCFCVSCPLCCAVWRPCWPLRWGSRRRTSPPATPHLRRRPPRCCPQTSCSSTVRSWPCSTSSTAACSHRGETHATLIFTCWTAHTHVVECEANTHSCSHSCHLRQYSAVCVALVGCWSHIEHAAEHL